MAEKKKNKKYVQDYEPSELEKFLNLFECPLALSDVNNKKLTYEQRCLILNATYDINAIKLFFKSKEDENKGILANVTTLERARLELAGLEETHARTNTLSDGNTVDTMAYELDLPAVTVDA